MESKNIADDPAVFMPQLIAELCAIARTDRYDPCSRHRSLLTLFRKDYVRGVITDGMRWRFAIYNAKDRSYQYSNRVRLNVVDDAAGVLQFSPATRVHFIAGVLLQWVCRVLIFLSTCFCTSNPNIMHRFEVLQENEWLISNPSPTSD